jgi:hypothetical protein
MRMNKVFHFLLLALLCVASLIANAQATKEKTIAPSQIGKGYIIGRYVIQCVPGKFKCSVPFDSISASYRGVDGHSFAGELEGVTGGAFRKNTKFDFNHRDSAEMGYYFCIALPAGKYEFYKHAYWNFKSGGSGYRMLENEYYSVPFEVKPQQITYIGTAKLTMGPSKKIWGVREYAAGVFQVSDGGEKDIKKALEKCSQSEQALPINNEPMNKVTIKDSLVVEVIR